jgi:hypothetical protein
MALKVEFTMQYVLVVSRFHPKTALTGGYETEKPEGFHPISPSYPSAVFCCLKKCVDDKATRHDRTSRKMLLINNVFRIEVEKTFQDLGRS